MYSFEDEFMDSGEEVVVVRAEMQPLVLETMTKFDDNEQVCQLPPWSTFSIVNICKKV